MLSFRPEARRSCCCTVATDMTRWWASSRCRRISSDCEPRDKPKPRLGGRGFARELDRRMGGTCEEEFIRVYNSGLA